LFGFLIFECQVRFGNAAISREATKIDLIYIYISFIGRKQWQTTPKNLPHTCSVPEPYRSHDWTLVPASPASKAEF